MRIKIKFIAIILYFFFNLQNYLSSEEFNFEGEEILILEEGNKLISKKGVKITTTDDLIFESNEFEYDKKK